ncbi:MAG: phosphoribosylglycinamide formyltransferase [Candidatus Kapaibacterium sp.]
MGKLRLGFLASHGGSNMQAIIDNCKSNRLDAVPAVVISNNSHSMALERARQEGIPWYHISRVSYPDEKSHDEAIIEALKEHESDLVILAGYMRKLGNTALEAFKNKVLNIHPAMLPKFGGKGMYGIKVHEAVLAAGEKETGVTVHLVNNEYDKGRILAQEKVAVLPGDTPQMLAERVLKTEHEIYSQVLQSIAEGRIKL